MKARQRPAKRGVMLFGLTTPPLARSSPDIPQASSCSAGVGCWFPLHLVLWGGSVPKCGALAYQNPLRGTILVRQSLI
ncbi:hypothetical protein F5144DRAFT_553931 [Chaetomium tenue]|uniref:Uncharacterized protein n=1 Tax=Chaetomium tenue TaxID=1854479 RepID=A0ACB7PP26_9PEZI|nr:hypothetical protein F5144DRAFT_553931 [Chaetomium globosum]